MEIGPSVDTGQRTLGRRDIRVFPATYDGKQPMDRRLQGICVKLDFLPPQSKPLGLACLKDAPLHLAFGIVF